MSVESKGLHAQNCVCRILACLCTVMSLPALPDMTECPLSEQAVMCALQAVVATPNNADYVHTIEQY